MDIQKLEFVKSFETELKNQLSIDKKYLPISKRLAALLRPINPFLDRVDQALQSHKDDYIQTSVIIHKTYAENLESYQRSLKLIIEKNQQEVEKAQKQKLLKTQELNGNLKAQLEEIEHKLMALDEETKDRLDKAEQAMKRELAQIQKIMVDARKAYQTISAEIEKEKDAAIVALKKAFDKSLDKVKKTSEKAEKTYQTKLEQMRLVSQQATDAHDETYLSIKNTYTELSISLNKKINELKKKHKTAVTQLEKKYQQDIKPVENAIETLKKSYQEAQQKTRQTFTEKLSALNVVFDVQKSTYESKKERIIHEGNEAITLLNSKLSAYRESVQRDKLQTSRDKRDEIKSIDDERERDKKNRRLTMELKSYDAELNRQILRTNKDILEKKRQTQRRLLAHDQNHLKEVHEWRLKKLLYDYEKKQEIAKIDLNFHHNISASESQLKLIETTYLIQKELLLLKHNQDLLPLEHQLQIAAAIQERELNLLANDAHLSIASHKHQEELLELDLKKQQADLQFEDIKIKTLYQADQQVLNTNTQLELEKEKVKRDYIISEQELRIELNQALFHKQKAAIEHEKQHVLFQIESERELLYIENKFKLETIRAEAIDEEQKRTFVVNEARYKHQQRLSNEKANRLLSTYENELIYTQLQTERLMDTMLMFYQTQQGFKQSMIDLYHLPSHPEVFKATMKLISQEIPAFKTSMHDMLGAFQSLNQDLYLAKIEDLTGYKYMLKHENTMNFYGQEIAKIKEKKKAIENDVASLQDQMLRIQTDIERNTQFIIQLEKITQEIKSNQLSTDHKHQDIKENQKLISNHDHEIKRLKQSLQRLEKDIGEKLLSIDPLDKEIEELSKKQDAQEKDLEAKKHKEAAVFYRFLSRNQAIYGSLMVQVDRYVDALQTFYQMLTDEVYVTDEILSSAVRKIEKDSDFFEDQIINHHQKLLDLMLEFYHKNQREQAALMADFKASTAALLKSLNTNYAHSLKTADMNAMKRAHDEKRQFKVQNDKTKKAIELDQMAYQKQMTLDQATLKSLEEKITENGEKGVQELKLLNDNQFSIATQYKHDYETKMAQQEDQHKKQLASIDQSILTSTKNQQGLETSLEQKNQAILNKYQATYEKYVANLKQRILHYDDEMKKLEAAKIQKTKTHEETLFRMNKKRESELINIQSHLKRYNQSTTHQQTKILHKEMRYLKKTHRAKTRMLHLT